jgi:hypothetical protein
MRTYWEHTHTKKPPQNWASCVHAALPQNWLSRIFTPPFCLSPFSLEHLLQASCEYPILADGGFDFWINLQSHD